MFRRASFLSDLILAARALLPVRASRRTVMLTAFALAACAEVPVVRAPKTVADGVLRRIAFGSCAKESRKQPILDAVIDANPELFVFLGDNVYGDTEDMAVLAGKYAKLTAQPGFQKLKGQAGIVATWDDHDYGADDVGRDYPMKRESKKLFLDFFGEPAESPRRLREGGIYTSYAFGPPGRRVQILMLDCRWDRTEVLFVDEKEKAQRRAEPIRIRPRACWARINGPGLKPSFPSPPSFASWAPARRSRWNSPAPRPGPISRSKRNA